MRRTIRITESDLHRIIEESVKTALNEISYDMARDAYKAACDDIENDMRQRKPISDKKDARRKRLFQHLSDRAPERFDPNMPVIIVGGDKQGYYTAQDLIDKFETRGISQPSENPIYNSGKTIGYPRIKGYIGPMWDGDKIRYETQEVYNAMSI